MNLNLAPPPFRVGNIEIQQVIEMQFPFLPTSVFLPDAPADIIESMRAEFEPWALCPETGKLILAVQTYVLRTSRHTILVDTCVGCNKNSSLEFWDMRDDAGWLTRLLSAGVALESVDYVFCTHLHGDHIGWNTRLIDGRYVPTFPNAKYLFSKAEIDYARNVADRRPAWEQSVLPVLEAGQAQLIDQDFALDDEVWVQSTPGHTPGHVAVHIASAGVEAVLTGDVIHSPLQCGYPHWAAAPDVDKPLAAITRQQVLEECLAENRLVLTSHFPAPSVGHVTAADRGFGFSFGVPDRA